MKNVIKQIDRTTNQARCLLVGRRIAVTFSCLLITILTLAALDWILRFGFEVRISFFIIIVVLLLSLIIAWIVPSLMFNPSRQSVALLLESHNPSIKGRLASAIEFEATGESRENPFAAQSIRETKRRLSRIPTPSIVDKWPAYRSIIFLIALFIIYGFLFLLIPNGSVIGLSRILSPGSSSTWPPRTAVASRMDSVLKNHRVHGDNTPLLLRAQNLTPSDPTGSVEARYRFIDGTDRSDWMNVLLTHQREGIHERQIMVEGDLLQLEFHTADASTKTEEVRILEVPLVTSMSLQITPPPHASPWVDTRLVESKSLVDGIQVVQNPVLEDSNLTLSISLNRPIQPPSDTDSRSEWFSRTLGVNSNTTQFDFNHTGSETSSWTIDWNAETDQRMLISLTDEFGLQSEVAIPVNIRVVPDENPDVVLLKPDRDVDVLPTAILPLSVKAVDDLPLKSLGIEILRQTNQVLKSDIQDQRANEGTLDSILDLSQSKAVDGDVLTIEGMAVDQWTDESGVHRTTRSRPRTIRVISESEFLTQMRDQMSLIGQRSSDIENRQTDIRNTFESRSNVNSTLTQSDGDGESFAESGDLRSLERSQSNISRLMSEQLESTRAIRDWIESNGMEDEIIDSVLDQVSESLQDAVSSSTQAVDSMESLRDVNPQEKSADSTSEIMQHQSDVQKSLQDVVSALTDDQDSWLISRQLDRIESDQRILQSETRRLSRELNGRPLEQAESDLQSSIQDASMRQQSILSDLSDLAQEIQNQAIDMEDIDPFKSETLQKVADQARESNIESTMSEASKQIQEGRMQMADASQQQALDSLDQMKQSMTPDRKDRIRDLLRRLSDIEQSIERLVDLQSKELRLLDESILTSDFSERDEGMIDLQRLTIAVTSSINTRNGDEQLIATRLQRASKAQGEAIGLLRMKPVEAQRVVSKEKTSLEQLQEALKDLTSLQSEGEQEMVEAERVQLAAIYRQLSDSQVDIRTRTGELLDLDEGSRRIRHESRRLGIEQKDLANEARKVRSENIEIEERPIFVLMHDRVEDLSQMVTDDLSNSNADKKTVIDQGRLARFYLSMAESIENNNSEEEEFERRSDVGQQGDQGGSSSSSEDGLLPPISELRLLRSLQFELMESTRLMDQINTETDERSAEVKRLSELQSNLAELGQEMFDRHINDGLPEDLQTEPVPPPSSRFDPVSTVDLNPVESTDRPGIRSLDELLGLESDDNSIDPTPLPSNHDPLEAIIDEMERVAILLGTDMNPGPPTQRLQQDIIRRIDTLIDQAREQQSSQSSSQSSSQKPSEEDMSGQQDQNQMQDGQKQPDETEMGSNGTESSTQGDSPTSMDVMDPKLGGAMDESGQEWGSLPARIRDLLQQGRQDKYSDVYEKLTGEYYRRIAEQEDDS